MPKQTISHADTFKAGANKGPLLSDGERGSYVMLATIENLGTPVAADADNICLAQTPAAAGNLTINGTGTSATVSGGVATMVSARNVTITCANAGDTTQVVTIYGTDINGNLQAERLTANGAATVTGLKAFKTVYRVAVSAAFAGTITVGTGLVLGLKHRAISPHRIITEGGTVTVGTFSQGTTTTQTATNADNRAKYTPASYAVEIQAMYFPDLTKDGVGYGMTGFPGPNYVEADQGYSNGAP